MSQKGLGLRAGGRAKGSRMTEGTREDGKDLKGHCQKGRMPRAWPHGYSLRWMGLLTLSLTIWSANNGWRLGSQGTHKVWRRDRPEFLPQDSYGGEYLESKCQEVEAGD